MWAVLSDIHANLEALDAVLADIAKFPVSHIFCLGDIVGYGPNPVECLQRVTDWDLLLIGDCDRDTLYDEVGFAGPNPRYWLMRWAQRQIEAAEDEALWDVFGSMGRSHTVGDFLMVHGSPRNPVHEYLFPEDVYNARKMERVASLFDRYCLCGHTHVPGVFIPPDADGDPWQFLSPGECWGFYRLKGRKTIVNVGSVGQPRDGDPRACYVLVDGWDVTWRRVAYDWQTTRDKIHSIPDIDDFQGDRLGEGR
jgi:diadenosine tetraphosphatase ApaH/serine/threonine PP2A family protein phosphatase